MLFLASDQSRFCTGGVNMAHGCLQRFKNDPFRVLKMIHPGS